MLKCRHIAAHASEHIDGELNWRQRLGYGLHLLLCGYCRQFIRQLRSSVHCARLMASKDMLPDHEARAIAERVLDHPQRLDV
jgi:hypothetical protein